MMSRLASIICILVLALASGRASSQDAVLRGGWVFDTQQLSFVKNDLLLVLDGKFAGATSPPHRERAARRTIQLGDDDYLLPGLIDLHAHHNVNLFGRRRRDETGVQPVVYLANGVTVAFSAGEYDPEEMLTLRRRIERGEQIGPRLITSGPYFGSVRRGWNREMPAEQIYQEVDHWVRMGAGGFKAKGIRREQLKALITAADRRGLTVTGHLGSGFRGSVNPRDAILMGINRIEHFLGGDTLPAERSAYGSLVSVTPDTSGFQEIVDLYVKRGVFFDATITAYGYFGQRREGYDYWVDERKFFTPFVQDHVATRSERRQIEAFEQIYWAKRKTVRAFFEAGGKLTLGTDHASTGEFLPGFSAHRELEAFVLAGIPPAEAIKIATLNGAQALKIDGQYGSIQPGKSADLLVVKGDPLESIRNTRTVHLVMKAGVFYRTEELLASVRGKLGPSGKEQAEAW